MLPYRSIRSLYPLALAEGEGVGTAYEYFAKRLALSRWMAGFPRGLRMLVAGLPEKYGASLDFLLLAQDVDAGALVVADDRPAALDKLRRSLAAAQAAGELARVQPRYELVGSLVRLGEVTGHFDLCVGSEVLQRLGDADRKRHVERLASLAPAVALFAPNGENPSHTGLSGLSGLTLPQLRALVGAAAGAPAASGHVDMPPFPPGLTRSAAQRDQAASGQVERLAMWGLGYYARMERYAPPAWRRRHAHIVYAFTERRPGA